MKKFITFLTVITLACAPVSVYAANSPEATTNGSGNTSEDPTTEPGGNTSPESPQTGSSSLPFVLLITAAGATLVAKKKTA